MSVFNTPFQNPIMKSAPGPHDNADDQNHYDTSSLNKPCDDKVISPTFYQVSDALNGSPAALASPMGTAIPNIGKGFNGK